MPGTESRVLKNTLGLRQKARAFPRKAVSGSAGI